MDDEDETFDLGQEASSGCVDRYAECQDGVEEECPVPAFIAVVRIVEDEKALDDGPCQEASTCCHGLPA